MTVEIPAAFRERAKSQAHWADWFAGLPALLRTLLGEWELTPVAATLSGFCAVVVPVRTSDGRSAMLKVGWPHWEAEYEHLALRIWDGAGAVRLYRADPRRFALLLEPADAERDLGSLPVLEACERIAELYARLHRPAPPPQFTRLSELCADWVERLPALAASGLIPRRLVIQAISLLRTFRSDPHIDDALIHTDLHFFNVLASDREPGDRDWLAIDPKPLAGDPAYEVAPLLWNRWGEALATGNLRQALLVRMFAVVDAAGLDEDRARAWVLIREVLNVLWDYENSLLGARLDRDWITRSTTVAKAVLR
jgi:streptomycin 6-kinase